MGVDVVDVLGLEARCEEREKLFFSVFVAAEGREGRNDELFFSTTKKLPPSSSSALSKRGNAPRATKREKPARSLTRSDGLLDARAHAGSVRPRLRHVVGVAAERSAGELAEDGGAPGAGVLERLEHEDAGALWRGGR